MFFFSITAAIIAILFLVTAAVILLKSSYTTFHLNFVFFLVACAVRMLSNSIADYALTDEVLLFFTGLGFVGASFSISAFLIFVDLFLGKKLTTLRLAIYFVPSFAFSILGFTEYTVLETFYPITTPAEITPGPVFVWFLIWLLSSMIYGLVRLWRMYKITTEEKREQLSYVLKAYFWILTGGLVFNAILPIMGENSFYNIAPQFGFVFALYIGRAIFKYQLIDLRPVLQRGFVYTITFSSIVALYASILSFTSSFFSDYGYYAWFFGGVLSIVIAVVTIPRLDIWLRNITDPIFFKGTYIYHEALATLTDILYNKPASLTQMLHMCEDELQKILRVSYVKIRQTKQELTGEETVVNLPLEKKHNGSIIIGPKISGENLSLTDQILVETFAKQASVSIARAFLFNQVKKHSSDLERQVAERTKQLQINQERQRQIMLQISHNLQTPLAILQTRIETLKKNSSTPDLMQLEYSVGMTSEFIRDLLRLSRLENNYEKVDLRTVNISQLVVELVEELEVIVFNDKIKINTRIEDEIFVEADSKKLREAIMNILSNAIKYIGTKEQKKVITVEVTKSKKFAKIVIRDNGIGISVEDQKNLFKPFFRSVNNVDIKGTGLGLAIVKEIISQHNGRIICTSVLGQGSVFSIVLPRRQYK